MADLHGVQAGCLDHEAPSDDGDRAVLRHDGPVAEELDKRRARALVQRYLDITDIRGGDAWVITDVEEADWGWVIHWTSRRAAEGSSSPADLYAGGGPYLVDRRSGRVAMCGSAHPVQHYVDAWRRGQWPDEPLPEGRDPLPEPWFDLRPRPHDPYPASRLAMTAELDRELMPGHVLHGEHAEPLAKCPHCDSVIYELPGERFALVHLAWAHGPEQPPWPQTAVFTSWTDALEAMGEHRT
jgi:hypothetical protein